MGEVKRYDMVQKSSMGGYERYNVMEEDDTGEYVLHSDYARLSARCAELERERDELAEQLATLQTDAYDAREDERAELTRLRTVEAAAIAYVDADNANRERFREFCALAESCGRKG